MGSRAKRKGCCLPLLGLTVRRPHSVVKKSACQYKRHRLDPWVGKTANCSGPPGAPRAASARWTSTGDQRYAWGPGPRDSRQSPEAVEEDLEARKKHAQAAVFRRQQWG